VPYLPIDPADVGRSYDSVIRVNSQSGKGGVAYLMETEYGVVMPRRLQVEFSAAVQAHTDAHGTEVSAGDLWRLFGDTYLNAGTALRYVEHHLFEDGDAQGIRLAVERNGQPMICEGRGNGPIAAALDALQMPVEVRSYEERSMGHSGDAQACAFVEVACGNSGRETFGVGIDANIVTASIKALVSGVNRLMTTTALQKAA
jgi:2-isopropylmalate synthase